MLSNTFEVIDLNFLNTPHTIAVFVVRWEAGAIMIETGPASTLPHLQAGLARLGLGPEAVTDVLLTHIHLDHAGAAWWLAQHGARIHVHARGAPHLIDPRRLLESAGRLYGDRLKELWGEMLPISSDHVHPLEDGNVVVIGGHRFEALDTPGHANHHMAYRYGTTCFAGDIGGVRLPGPRHLRLPTPPPEFHLEKWRASLARLREGRFDRLVATHFGPFDDVSWHLDALEKLLDDVEALMQAELPGQPFIETLRERVAAWNRDRAVTDGVDPATQAKYETALPSGTSADGMMRYWEKFRT